MGDMIGFEADRMFNLILNDDIKTERNVILEERRWRRETNPQVCWTRRSTRRCGRSALPHPVNGWMQEMDKLNTPTHSRSTTNAADPNNAVLVVAGDAEPETVKALAAKTYGKVARGPVLPPRT
ncbi:hypothetical protein [Mesorhizobium sp. M0227]|uniref:hypothetical protein n=1 Tax=Mesorhizobium sp. M0227 TaxID=2956922 RepID=UPI00333DEC49